MWPTPARVGCTRPPEYVQSATSRTYDRTIVYGVLGLDGEQIFRQYDKFNGDTAVYLKEVKNESVEPSLEWIARHSTGLA